MANWNLVQLAALGLLTGGLLQQASARTVLDGVYSEAQAARGQTAFRANCQRCHADNLLGQGSAPLVGSMFLERWREDGLDTIFEDISTRMPNDDPGKLSADMYLDILTFILKTNGFPSGASELSTTALPETMLVGKNGPQPLPSNSLVAAVGCATAGPNNTWRLTNAVEPARTKDAEDISGDEKKNFAAKALGMQAFRLQTSTRIAADFTFDPFKGHKVLAKGVLIREANNDRISVSAFESLGATCGP